MTEAPPARTPWPTATAPAPRSRRLPRRWRNLLLCVHIVVAVGALGTDTILLTLGVTGLVSSDANLVRAAYLAMDLLVTAVLLPLALAALASGVLLGLGTRWGLARHWWVLAKLALTIGGGQRRGGAATSRGQPGRGHGAGAAAGGVANRRR